MLKVNVPHTSTRSGPAGHCLEATVQPDGSVLTRNTNDPTGNTIAYTGAEWDAFLAGAKDGEFDRP